MKPTPAELAAIAAAYAVLAARTTPPLAPVTRWRQAGRPVPGGDALARGGATISRWARAGRARD